MRVKISKFFDDIKFTGPIIGKEISINNIDEDIKLGALEKWLSSRVKSLDSFNTSSELFEHDSNLFWEYTCERIEFHRLTHDYKPVDKREFHPEAVEFNVMLELFGEYDESPLARHDREAFDNFSKGRLKEWKELNGRNDSLSSSDTDSKSNEHTKDEISEADVAREVRELYNPVQIQIEQQISPVEVSSDEVISKSVEEVISEKPVKKKGRSKVKQEPFPALIILKKAIDKKEQLRNETMQIHDIALGELAEAEIKKENAEKEVRKFDTEKESCVLNSRRIPEDLMGKIVEANDKVLDAERERVKIAKVYYEVHKIAIKLVELDQIKVLEVKPKSTSSAKQKEVIDEVKLASIISEHDKAYAQREAIKECLISALAQNPIKYEAVEKAVQKIKNNDFTGLKKILPSELEMVFKKELAMVDTGLVVDDLIKEHKTVVELSKEIKFATPLQIVNLRQQHLGGLRASKDKAKDKLQEYLRAESSPNKKTVARLQRKIDEARILEDLAVTQCYKTLIENTAQQTREYSEHRKKLAELVTGVMEKEKISSPEKALMIVIEQNYRIVRKIGEPIPQVSIQGVSHVPSETIVIAQQSSNGVDPEKAKEKDHWQYRIPRNYLEGVSFDGEESHDRLSCRLVANHETIQMLDTLSKKYKFVYKFPIKPDSWRRADTVTIYFMGKSEPKWTKDIAQKLQKFTFSGDDDALLGSPILNDNGEPLSGVRYSEGVFLMDLVKPVQMSYMIDPMLGNVVSNYYGIKEVNGKVKYSVSPGMEAAVQKLLKDIS